MMDMGVRDFLERWQMVVGRLELEKDADMLLQHVAFGLWRIWKCRNAAVFTGTHILLQDGVDLWRQ